MDRFDDLFIAKEPSIMSESVVMPILHTYKELRQNLLVVSIVILPFLIGDELLRGGSVCALVYMFGWILVIGLSVLTRSKPATLEFLDIFDKALFVAATAFQVLCAGILSTISGLDALKMYFLFAVPTAVVVELRCRFYRNAFLTVQIICALIVSWDPTELVPAIANLGYIGVTAQCLESLVGAAEALEKQNAEKHEDMVKAQAARQQMMLQWRMLLDRAFDGIAQVSQGQIQWISDKLSAALPLLEVGHPLHASFRSEDLPRIEAACEHFGGARHADDLATVPLVTCIRGLDQKEVDCILMSCGAAIEPDRNWSELSPILIGVRVIGEPRSVLKGDDDLDMEPCDDSCSKAGSQEDADEEDAVHDKHGGFRAQDRQSEVSHWTGKSVSTLASLDGFARYRAKSRHQSPAD